MRATVAVIVLVLLAAASPHAILAQTPAAETGCGGPATPAASATPVSTTEWKPLELDSGPVRLWPGGDRGVLLLQGASYDAGSWIPQVAALEAEGYTVLAPEFPSPAVVLDAIAFLTGACGVTGVTVIGASAGGSTALEGLAADPEGVAGLILLGAIGDVADLGDYPKLFTASEGESLVDRVEVMTAEAPGDRNDTLILPGSAHAQATFDTDQGEALLDAMLSFLKDTAEWDAE
jgi:pimeloyl-ACP methyl ester carboxylesterase